MNLLTSTSMGKFIIAGMPLLHVTSFERSQWRIQDRAVGAAAPLPGGQGIFKIKVLCYVFRGCQIVSRLSKVEY